MMRNAQHHLPAPRFAQRVMEMTPLFYENGVRMACWHGYNAPKGVVFTWAKVDKGVTVNKAEKNPPMPSAYIQRPVRKDLSGRDQMYSQERLPEFWSQILALELQLWILLRKL